MSSARLAFAFLLAVAAGSASAGDIPPRPLAKGDAALSVEAFRHGGGVLRLDDYRGQVVMLDFWASWCAPCLESMPAYDAMYQRLKDRDFVIIGLGIDHDRRAALRALEQVDVSFPVAFDPMNHWSQRFRLMGMPSAYLIDHEGVIQKVYVGFSKEYLPTLEAAIIAMIEEAEAARERAGERSAQ